MRTARRTRSAAVPTPRTCSPAWPESCPRLPDPEQHFDRQLIELFVAQALRGDLAAIERLRDELVAIARRVLREQRLAARHLLQETLNLRVGVPARRLLLE